MGHKLKERMAAVCATKEELRMAIEVCEAAGVPIFSESLTGENDEGFPDITFHDQEVCQTAARNKPEYPRTWIPLSEFLARAIGVEPKPVVKELTVEKAKELLAKSVRLWFIPSWKWDQYVTELAEYGITKD